MESVPFTNVYGLVAPNGAAPGRSALAPTDAKAFQAALAAAHSEVETAEASRLPAASLAFSKMAAGVTLPQGLSRPEPQTPVDRARTTLYQNVLGERGVPSDMISRLAAGGGVEAFLALRGVLPQGNLEAREAELQTRAS